MIYGREWCHIRYRTEFYLSNEPNKRKIDAWMVKFIIDGHMNKIHIPPI